MSKQARKENRNRRTTDRSADYNWSLIAMVVAALVIVAVGVVVVQNSKDDKAQEGVPTLAPIDEAAPANVTKAISDIPASTFNKIGKGDPDGKPQAIQAAALTKDGKPRIIYVGAEFCPFCAAQRWPLAIALERFGDFENLRISSSAPAPEPSPNTPTLSFRGSKYNSDYIVFEPVEVQGNDTNRSTLETPSKEIQALWDKYNRGSYPFVDFGGKWIFSQTNTQPSHFDGMDHDDVVKALENPNSALAKKVFAGANQITAMLCELTNNQPADVCTAQIKEIQKSL